MSVRLAQRACVLAHLHVGSRARVPAGERLSRAPRKGKGFGLVLAAPFARERAAQMGGVQAGVASAARVCPRARALAWLRRAEGKGRAERGEQGEREASAACSGQR